MPESTDRAPRRTDDALASIDYADAVAGRTPAVPLEVPPAPRTWRDAALVQLWLARLREFVREPEAVFWSFVFPLLLAAGLGIAFRHRPPDRAPIAVAVPRTPDDPVADAIGRSEAQRLGGTLAGDSALRVQLLDDSAAARALRTGEVTVVVTPGSRGAVTYRYDPTRP